MEIFFQLHDVHITPHTKDHITSRVEGLQKFFKQTAKVYIDIKKTRSDNNGDDLFYVSLHIEEGKLRYFTEEYEENIRKAFDETYQEMFRIVRDDRSKSQSLARRAGAQLKRLLRRKK
jgi:ribosomal subunit interface protein